MAWSQHHQTESSQVTKPSIPFFPTVGSNFVFVGRRSQQNPVQRQNTEYPRHIEAKSPDHQARPHRNRIKALPFTNWYWQGSCLCFWLVPRGNAMHAWSVKGKANPSWRCNYELLWLFPLGGISGMIAKTIRSLWVSGKLNMGRKRVSDSNFIQKQSSDCTGD